MRPHVSAPHSSDFACLPQEETTLPKKTHTCDRILKKNSEISRRSLCLGRSGDGPEAKPVGVLQRCKGLTREQLLLVRPALTSALSSSRNGLYVGPLR